MTREEAIEELEILRENYWDDDGYGHETKQYDDTMLALDIAIKALEQEPCEDCISRKTAKEKAWGLCLETGYDNERVVEMLDDLPSVRPAPKKGRWIGHREHCENLGMMPNGLGVFEWCSNCDCAIDIREYQRNHYNYCPNCGAKMEVE